MKTSVLDVEANPSPPPALRLGKFTATAGYPRGGVMPVVEWEPHEPGKMSKKQLAKYRTWRDEKVYPWLTHLTGKKSMRVLTVE